MTELEPDRQVYSIVVLGDFNPSIFQPLWFSLNGLIPEEEAQNAEIAIIHQRLASFSIGKIQIHVDSSRLSLTTDESPQAPILRDVSIGTLSILEHTPLKAIGLNHDMVFSMGTDEAWREVGDKLVPKSIWEGVFDCPEMRQVVVEGHRSNCSADRLQIRVQPSANHEVLIAINQHYQLENEQRDKVCDRHFEAIRVLQEDWTLFGKYAREATEKLLHLSPTRDQTE